MRSSDIAAVLEVIRRTGECADPLMVAYCLSVGYAVEHGGRLELTRAGKARLSGTGTRT